MAAPPGQHAISADNAPVTSIHHRKLPWDVNFFDKIRGAPAYRYLPSLTSDLTLTLVSKPMHTSAARHLVFQGLAADMSPCNPSMAYVCTGIVSKNKRRYKDDKYDLDLAYITDHLIAMGAPSQGSRGTALPQLLS